MLSRLIKRVSVTLLLAVAPVVALAATPESYLRELINSEDELRIVFGKSAHYQGSVSRAEAFVTSGSKRHAIVMYKAHTMTSGFGQKICHAALGRKARTDWLGMLAAAAGDDPLVAKYLAVGSSPTIRFKGIENGTLSDWKGWQVGVCVVPELNIQVTYPAVPEASSIRRATYEVGKQLYAAGDKNAALDRFKSLKSDARLYANARLFVIAILQDDYPEMAKTLSERDVNLDEVDDGDAVEAYIQFFQKEK